MPADLRNVGCRRRHVFARVRNTCIRVRVSTVACYCYPWQTQGAIRFDTSYSRYPRSSCAAARISGNPACSSLENNSEAAHSRTILLCGFCSMAKFGRLFFSISRSADERLLCFRGGNSEGTCSATGYAMIQQDPSGSWDLLAVRKSFLEHDPSPLQLELLIRPGVLDDLLQQCRAFRGQY